MFYKKNIFCLFFAFNIFQITNGVEFISIGFDCTVASILRDLGLRKAAYPFDWMFAPFNSVYSAISEDFANFLNPISLKIDPFNPKIILDYYGLQFVHDFPTVHHSAALDDNQTHEWSEIRMDWQDFIDPIRQKYARRIIRFQEALLSNEKIYLIHSSHLIEQDPIIKLRDFISLKYPALNFSLLIINNRIDIVEEWNLEKIIYIGICHSNKDYMQKWKSLFISLQN